MLESLLSVVFSLSGRPRLQKMHCKAGGDDMDFEAR